eukprot:TRINITY_DN3730_c0_g1_i1.p1 TRINITY_DN3730_c0_g1~~TRINITY_DN3730_c0_g1_i1.p1  ORF type:complete len:565 (+),score=124.85 TRINITY_DN3730_c0_g1_i1:206-1900(+)
MAIGNLRIANVQLVCIAVILLLSPAFAQQTINLGFMIPYPNNDSSVPIRLANEWISAIRVALEVLGPQYASHLKVMPKVANSNCNAESAKAAAKELLAIGVAGVVGPACSEAVLGAAEVLGPAGVPFISFAATADSLRDRKQYPTFFRTAYGDRHQVAAMHSVISAMKWTKLVIFYTSEEYGEALAYNILANNPSLKMQRISVPIDPLPTEYEQFFRSNNLISTDEHTVIILATTPRAAEGLLTAAQSMGYLKFPWWYFGTDGATAFDLVSQGTELQSSLVSQLQGELGLQPYGSVLESATEEFSQFVQYWQLQKYSDYPGLLTLPVTPRFTKTRAYVPYLIDAVWAFFEAFNNIVVVQGKNVDAMLVLKCLYDDPVDCVNFSGCSGVVAFDKTTGERRKDLAPPKYDLTNLEGVTWTARATWDETKMALFAISPSILTRPGPFPTSPSTATPAEAVVAAAPYAAPAAFFEDAPVSGTIGTLGVANSAVNTNLPPPPSPAAAKPVTAPASGSDSSLLVTTKTSTGVMVGMIIIGAAVAITFTIALYTWHKANIASSGQQFVRML